MDSGTVQVDRDDLIDMMKDIQEFNGLARELTKKVDSLHNGDRINELAGTVNTLATTVKVIEGTTGRTEEAVGKVEEKMSSLPCHDRELQLELLKQKVGQPSVEEAVLKEKVERHSVNWGLVVALVLGLIQAGISTYIGIIITQALGG